MAYSSNTVANMRHNSLDEFVIPAIRIIVRLNSDGVDSGSKKCKEVLVVSGRYYVSQLVEIHGVLLLRLLYAFMAWHLRTGTTLNFTEKELHFYELVIY
jgi:hypothetical protein